MATIGKIEMTTCTALHAGSPSYARITSQGVLNTYRSGVFPNDNLAEVGVCGESRGTDGVYSDTGINDAFGQAYSRAGCTVDNPDGFEGEAFLFQPRDSAATGEIAVWRFPWGAGNRSHAHEDISEIFADVNYITHCAVRLNNPYGYGMAWGSSTGKSILYRWDRSGEGSGPTNGMANPVTLMYNFGLIDDYEYVDIDINGDVWVAGNSQLVDDLATAHKLDADGNLLASVVLDADHRFFDAIACWRDTAIAVSSTDFFTSDYNDIYHIYQLVEVGGVLQPTLINDRITIDGVPYPQWCNDGETFIDPENTVVSVMGDRIIMQTVDGMILQGIVYSADVDFVIVGTTHFAGVE